MKPYSPNSVYLFVLSSPTRQPPVCGRWNGLEVRIFRLFGKKFLKIEPHLRYYSIAIDFVVFSPRPVCRVLNASPRYPYVDSSVWHEQSHWAWSAGFEGEHDFRRPPVPLAAASTQISIEPMIQCCSLLLFHSRPVDAKVMIL
jgi:hypothetical protein